MRGLNALFFLFAGGLLAFVLLVGVFLFGGLFTSPKGPRRRMFLAQRMAMLARVASGLGGELVNQPQRYRYPFVRVPEGSSTCLLILTTQGDDPENPFIVTFEAPIEGRKFVEAWPKDSPFQPFRMTSGLPEVTTGDGTFDGLHVVRADDVAHARAVLTAEVRGALLRMRQLGHRGRVRFDLYAHKVVVQKEEQVEDEETLRALAAEFPKVVAGLRAALAAQSGVEFLENAPKSTHMQCPVCGTEAKERKVECRRCKTPHHQECWEYFGACATFACGEKRFTAA